VPQLILARFRENALAGRYVEAQGLGRVWRIDQIDAEAVLEAAAALRSDGELLGRARERAQEFRTWFGPDPTEVVARAAISIYAGGGVPQPRHHT
jgi:UDP:flavonoid glycosyltransferase YjiC (YdhE family)